MSIVEKISIGVPGLDILTYGGIPKGRATLIAGRSGAGKSILGLQIACHLARVGIKTIVIAVEEEPADLATTGDALGFKFSELTASGALIVTDLTSTGETETIVTGEYDLGGLVHRVRATVEKTGAQALVLDSSTALFSERPPENQLRRMFFQLLYSLKKLGLTSVVTAEAPADYGQHTVLGVEDFVCDLVITLRNVVDGERRRRSIEVHKYRRSAHYKGEYPCTITAKGISVFPLDAPDHEVASSSNRYSSGVEGLDQMNNGGWLRDSIVLVRGPTGSGKTTIAGMYARAGAARGERVVYYGFEEPKPILLRNFENIGLPMAEIEKSGHLQIRCRYPEATSPEDLLIDLRIGLEEIKPDLIVLDSISSIEHATSAPTFRHFMIGLASLLREHGRSALLTQTIASQSEAEQAAPYLSTVCDAIVILDYTLNRPQMTRTMRVLKMRGSRHATDQHQVTIDPGGLFVSAGLPDLGASP
jgi:circadian clock protein KaiC